MNLSNGILGKRCVVMLRQQIDPKADKPNDESNYHRVPFKAVIVAVGFAGDYASTCMLVMYDDGSLGAPGYQNVKIVTEDGEGPYR